MQEDREVRAGVAPWFLSHRLPAESGEGMVGDAALWLTGGASLLLWTAVALLLTSA